MTNETYGRGQVEWALWRSFTRSSAVKSDVPKVFRTRVKRLLDIDRDFDFAKAEVPPVTDFAFVAPPSLEGGESQFSAFDAFCLAIALDLLDAGFKQSEVVFLMRYVRPEFEERFSSMLAGPLLFNRQRHFSKRYPDLPAYEEKGQKYADGRMFLIVKKVELTEINPKKLDGGAIGPVFLEPEFCEGVTALGIVLSETMPNHRRVVTVVELAATAQVVQFWLAKAPKIRRGRPKA